jgi:Rps23 Pro-64 3,4-dihydroxylase Tpa1-like proline 4-hydroxylase
MHISNCLEDPEKIVSGLEFKTWKEMLNKDGVTGHFCFFKEPDVEYTQILDAMLQAAKIFLLNTGRDIADYEKRYDSHRVVKWEQKGRYLVQHVDRWSTGGDQITPDISLSMYLTDDYEGGGLNFSLLDKTIRPLAGDIVAFDHHQLHGTEPYLGGRRITIQFYLFKKEKGETNDKEEDKASA